MSTDIPANIRREQQALAESRTLKPGEENHYRVWQGCASPYSHKFMTYMNYKGIPYKRLTANKSVYMEEIPKLVGQVMVPVVITPDEQVMQDSTPIMEWFEKEYPKNSAIPENPTLAFIMWLLEEFADEYMPRIMMHTRWGNAQNRHTISHRIARTMTFADAHQTSADLAPTFLKRQSSFDAFLGLSDEKVRPNMDQQLLDLLRLLEEHFKHNQFLLGFRPSLADFSLYGPMKIHIFNDPQSNEIIEVNAPRTCRWLDTISELGDTRGCVGQTEFGDWVSPEISETLLKILQFVGKTYIPFAKDCAIASNLKQKQFETEVYGITSTFGTHQYRVWSFEQLQLRYQALKEESKIAVNTILTNAFIKPDIIAKDIVHNGLYDGFTPPFVKDGVCNARIRHIKEKAEYTK